MLLPKCYGLRLYRTERKDLIFPEVDEIIYTFLLDSLFQSLEIQHCVKLTMPSLIVLSAVTSPQYFINHFEEHK